ncbi:hypothetical protein C2845_PM01G45160 [Panicum miliaceum]|uniref:Uncharacterized protein n=1 Tax=Panicum miliaceum TaxID=4540 RepID=A0A3L6TR68_PANMI|nr:hypothetical protein C2845_PM01G45160 [Panicum miliaceum]
MYHLSWKKQAAAARVHAAARYFPSGVVRVFRRPTRVFRRPDGNVPLGWCANCGSDSEGLPVGISIGVIYFRAYGRLLS